MRTEPAGRVRAATRRDSRLRRRRLWGTLLALLLVVFVAEPHAGGQTAFSGGTSATIVAAETGDIDLLVGRSIVLNLRRPIARVSLTVPDIADALVTGPQQVLIHGKAPGTISLFVWDHSGGINTYEVVVRRDLNSLQERLRQLFPGEPIAAASNGSHIVLSGRASTKDVIEKATDVAAGYVATKEDVVNLVRLQEGIPSQQVMLRVRFAEVSRSALQELGLSLFAHGFQDGEWFGRTTTQQFPAPSWDVQGRLIFSDFLNLFVFNSNEGLGGVLRAMQDRGLFQSLAEPNLIALDGTEASFLAGGEFLYPVVQGSGANIAVTLQFKEFGVRLSFVPTLLGGDLVHLRVRPEVSSLDFANAVTVQGFRVPALLTRRTETAVELRDGQTFAIAGLMNNTVSETMAKIPGIGDIPILGYLFRSRAHQKNQTELVVMITPQIVRPGEPGVAPDLPGMVVPFLGPPPRTMPAPPPWPPGAAGAPAPGMLAPAGERVAPYTAPPVERGGDMATPAPDSPGGGVPAAGQMPPVPAAQPRPMTRQERRQLEQQRRAQGRQLEAERKQKEKLAREQAKREAEAAKRAAEIARRQAEEEQKRQRALAEAEERLRAAQEAYRAELEQAGGGSTDTRQEDAEAQSPDRNNESKDRDKDSEPPS